MSEVFIFYLTTFNSCVLFCLLKDKRVFFGHPDQKMKSNIKMTPKTTLKFDGGSFEAIKFFSKFFFTGCLTGSESENRRYDQPAEVI